MSATPLKAGPGLAEGASQLGLALTDLQLDQLEQFARELIRWGKVFNLTAVLDLEAIRTQHLLDCLSLVAALKAKRKELWYFSPPNPTTKQTPLQPLTILDVGSGAGLPAIVLAICSNQDHLPMIVHSVDPVEKKIAFQRQIKAQLQLGNLTAHHERVEKLAVAPFDLITCRAYASLADFIGTSGHLLKSSLSARLVAMKARTDFHEQGAVPKPWQIIEQQALTVPGLEHASRQLIWLAKAPLKTQQQ